MDWLKKLEKILSNEKLIFYVSVTAGIVFSLLSVIFIYDIYRDVANVYAYNAREIANGNFAEGWESRVPMLNILLAGGISFCGVDPYRATVVVSSLFFVLTLFPLRRYLELFLTPLQSAWGCLLFITAPKIIRFSVSGMIDSSRYFFLITSLLLLFQLREKPRIGKAVLFGLSLAGLSVSRGEELVFAVAILIGLPVLTFLKSPDLFRSEFKKRTAVLGISAFFFLAAVSPFCTVNACRGGAFITDVRIAEAMGFKSDRRSPEKTLSETNQPAYKDGRQFKHSFSSVLRGGYELYWVFSIFGMFLLLRKRNWKWEHTVLTGVFLAHTAIYYLIGSAYRYSLYLIPMFMPFTMTGLGFFCVLPQKMNWSERVRLTAVAAVFVLMCLIFGIQIRNGMEIVFARKDKWIRQVADTMIQWGRKNVPDRRLRVASFGLVEAVYWSGAYSVFNYKDGVQDMKHFRDFDLLLIPESHLAEISERRDLRPVPLPAPKKRPRDASDRYYLFCRENRMEGK